MKVEQNRDGQSDRNGEGDGEGEEQDAQAAGDRPHEDRCPRASRPSVQTERDHEREHEDEEDIERGGQIAVEAIADDGLSAAERPSHSDHQPDRGVDENEGEQRREPDEQDRDGADLRRKRPVLAEQPPAKFRGPIADPVIDGSEEEVNDVAEVDRSFREGRPVRFVDVQLAGSAVTVTRRATGGPSTAPPAAPAIPSASMSSVSNFVCWPTPWTTSAANLGASGRRSSCGPNARATSERKPLGGFGEDRGSPTTNCRFADREELLVDSTATPPPHRPRLIGPSRAVRTSRGSGA